MNARPSTHDATSPAPGRPLAGAGLAQALLDAIEEAGLLLDGEGRPILMNGPAQRLFDSVHVLAWEAGLVVPTDLRRRRPWRAALASALQGSPTLCTLGEHQSWMASVVRLALPGDGDVLLVRIRDGVDVAAAGAGRARGAVQAYARMHGLTPAEADVLAQLASGAGPADVARRNRRSINTVRTQVRSILSKLGLHGLQPLVAQVARLPPLPVVDERVSDRADAIRFDRERRPAKPPAPASAAPFPPAPSDLLQAWAFPQSARVRPPGPSTAGASQLREQC